MIESPPEPTVSALPRSRTRLIGRDREVADLVDLLARDDVPLVTITGPGGAGKTRLALAVAGEVGPSFQDGVWLVPLAPVRDAALVPSAVAGALGLRESAEVEAVELVRRFLADRHALLVLDNVEQVVDAAWFVASVLETCSGVTVLATSRTRLRISDEREYPLPPLSTPVAGEEATPDGAAESGAVRLFVERARAASPRFTLDVGNVAVVAEVCRRLDGQPLAIELAAARVRTLAPAALLDRLERSLALLVDGRRDAPNRQRTMRDAIAWSYDLLAEREREVLRRLAIFVGGFSLEAAEAVCVDLDVDAIATVASLVDQSLVQELDTSVPATGAVLDRAAPSHRLLETVREFGLEQLGAHGEEDAARLLHADYFVSLAERRREPRDQGTKAITASDVHLGNWRAVLDWARRTDDRALACRLANALMSYWSIRCHLSEGRSWFEWVLEARDDLPVELRAPAEASHGMFAYLTGDHAAAASILERAVRELRVLGDAGQLAWGLYHLGQALLNVGDVGRAREVSQESLEISRAGGSIVRDGGWAAWPLKTLSSLAALEGDVESATTLLRESLEVARATDQSWATAAALGGLAGVDGAFGRTGRAAEALRESLGLFYGVGDVALVALTLGEIATLSSGKGGGARAAELLGARAGHLARVGRDPGPQFAPAVAQAMTRLQGQMGEAAFAAAWDRGRHLELDDAVQLGRAEADRLATERPSGAGSAGGTAGLSAREAEVIGLLAAGKSDQEIADALFVSKRTASSHVSSILTKLGLANRAEAAAWAVRNGLA